MGGQKAAEGESKHCGGNMRGGNGWTDDDSNRAERRSGDRIFDVGRDYACSFAGDSGPDLWGAKARRGRIIFPKRIPRSEVHCSISGTGNNERGIPSSREGRRAR